MIVVARATVVNHSQNDIILVGIVEAPVIVVSELDVIGNLRCGLIYNKFFWHCMNSIVKLNITIYENIHGQASV